MPHNFSGIFLFLSVGMLLLIIYYFWNMGFMI